MTRVLSAFQRPAFAILRWFGLRPSRGGGGALTYTYDADLDYLIGHIGEPRPCLNVEVPPGVVIRISQDTHEIAGLEVVDCTALFGKKPIAVTHDFVANLLDTYGPQALSALRHRLTLTPSPGRP